MAQWTGLVAPSPKQKGIIWGILAGGLAWIGWRTLHKDKAQYIALTQERRQMMVAEGRNQWHPE